MKKYTWNYVSGYVGFMVAVAIYIEIIYGSPGPPSFSFHPSLTCGRRHEVCAN